MTVRYMIIKGDKTTHGGTVLEGHESYMIEDAPVACMGHQVYCPQCGGNYPIVEGTTRHNIFGQPAALEGMKTACGAELISSQRLSCVEIDSAADIVSHAASMRAFYANHTPTQPQPQSYTSETSYHSGGRVLLEEEEEEEEISPIRLDAAELMICAQDICDKHLHYPEVKQAFMDEVDAFAEQIVHDVESGQMTYEDGAQELKNEEKSLLNQVIDISLKGIGVLGAFSQLALGAGVCIGSWGMGCAFGVPLMLHGANTLEETAGQAIYGEEYAGITRKGYHYMADFFGYSEKAGDIAYNSVDIMLSIKGMTREVLKPGTWKLFRHIKDDFEKAYKQMTKTALSLEIIADTISISNILNKLEVHPLSALKNVIICDKEMEESALLLKEPEKIKHATDILDEEKCSTLITIDFDDNPHKLRPQYICHRNGQLSRYIY